MAGHAHTASDLRDALAAVAKHGSIMGAARALGVPRPTMQGRVRAARARLGEDVPDSPFEPIALPSEELPLDELLKHRKRVYELKNDAKTARKLVPVRVRLDGPIGIAHFGDPHVDDDGCDIGRLESDLKAVRRTDGLFGANLGDLQNNWIGRLARLYSEQSTTARQAWQLVEWMVGSVDWLYIIGGNHDAWSGAGDPLQWLMKAAPGAYEYHGIRIGLTFPNKKVVRVNARHDFSGHSMWNPAHGPMKAVQGGWRDHILTCGHKHTSFVAGPLKDPASSLLSWAIRCAGYKVWDRYAEEKGLPDQNAFPAAVTIIDPQFDDGDSRLVTVIPNVEEGAEYLTWKRKKWARSQR